MNAAVWRVIEAGLPAWVRPVFVDLPGHGLRHEESFQSLDDLVDFLDQQLTEPSVLVGWSMGGLATLQLALQRPEKVLGLMQVSSNPAFVSSEHWPHGVASEVFQQFARNLQQDYAATLKRFLGLQVRGADNERQLLKQLRELMAQQPAPSQASLEAGLKLLLETDLVDELDQCQAPVSFLLGGRDTLVPVSCGKALQAGFPELDVTIIDNAGHAPFLSHPGVFIDALIKLCRQGQHVAA